MHEVINWYFVWGNPIDSEFPQKYGMFSPEGDELVANAVKSFVENACQIGAALLIGAARNNALENPEIITATGNSYDLFLGSSNEPVQAEKPASDSAYDDYDE